MTDTSNQGQQPAEPVIPPLTKEQIHAAEETARFLDPDLANAIMQGNKLVIQAVAAGAQTTQQVVDLMLRQGALPEMCPPGVRELLQERLKEIEAKREEEEAFQRRMAAALVGTMAAMAGSEAMAAEGGGSGSRTAQTQQASEGSYPNIMTEQQLMDIADRMDKAASITPERWNSMSHEEKAQTVQQVHTDNTSLANHTTDELRQTMDKLQAQVDRGEMTEQQKANIVGAITATASGIEWEEKKGPDGKSLLDKDGRPIMVPANFDPKHLEEYLDKKVASGEMSPEDREKAYKTSADWLNAVEATRAQEMSGEGQKKFDAGQEELAGHYTVGSAQIAAQTARHAAVAATMDTQCVNPASVGLVSRKAAAIQQQLQAEAEALPRDVPHTEEQNQMRLETARGTVKLEIIEEEMQRARLTATEREQVRDAAVSGKMGGLDPKLKMLAEIYKEGIAEGGDPHVAAQYAETQQRASLAGSILERGERSLIEGSGSDLRRQSGAGAAAAQYDAARQENVDAGKDMAVKLDATEGSKLVAAGASASGFGLDDDATTPKSVAARTTIAVPPDKLGVDSTLMAQLGAPANDAPPPAAAPEEKLRPAAPSQGMGGMG